MILHTQHSIAGNDGVHDGSKDGVGNFLVAEMHGLNNEHTSMKHNLQ